MRRDILILLLFIFIFAGLIPWIPEGAVDPWGLLKLNKVARVVCAIALIQFIGHAAGRALGSRAGTLLSGALGGLVSSTAVFITLSHKARAAKGPVRVIAAAALLAILGMLGEFLVILYLSAPELLEAAGFPVLAMMISGLIFALVLGRREPEARSEDPAGPENRFDLTTVLKFSFFVIAMLAAAALLNRAVGDRWFQAAIFVGSFFELHSVTFSVASLFVADQIQKGPAELALGLALTGAHLSKFLIMWTIDRGRFAAVTSAILLVLLGIGAATYVLETRWPA